MQDLQAEHVVKIKWVFKVKRQATGAPLFKAETSGKGVLTG